MKRLLLLLTLIPTAASADGINCNRATKPNEMIVCSTPSLLGRDARLADNYRWLHDSLPRTHDRRSLELAEANWVREMESCGFNADCLAEGYDSQTDKVVGALHMLGLGER